MAFSVVGLAIVATGAAAATGAANPPTRPLVFVPAALTQQAKRPCALYACASDLKAHTSWQNTVGALPQNYCDQFKCSPMDLIPVNGVDDNLFPLNPEWAYFVQHGTTPNADQLCGSFSNGLGSPPCTSQPVSYDAPGVDTAAYGLCPAGRSPYFSFHGHVNYEPATYQGILSWFDHSSAFFDDDYSLNLRTVNGAALTGNDQNSVHIEFDSDETIDHFDSSQWWQQFHQNVDDGRGRVINGDYAVVTGLAGLDTAHTTSTELHPVYAIAIEDMRQYAQVYGQDEWAIFARNWGNEGFCSQRKHPLPPGPLTIRIPWFYKGNGALARPASAVQILSTNDFYTNINNGSGTLSILPGQGILLKFDLSTPPAQEPLFWGTLDLKWTFGSTPPPPITTSPGTTVPRPTPSTKPSTSTTPPSAESADVEARTATLLTKLPPAARTKAVTSVKRPVLHFVVRHSAMVVAGPPRIPVRRNGTAAITAIDPTQISIGRAEKRALCGAYHMHIPAYPKLC